MAACSSNVSPMVQGFLLLAIKYDIWDEARSAFVDVVTAVFIKFNCFHTSRNFRSNNPSGLFTKNFTTYNTLWMFFSIHQLINVWYFLTLPFFFYSRRTMAFFCRTTCTTDMLTTFRLFYKSGVHIFYHSEFILHTVVMSTASHDSDKLRPQFLIIWALTCASCISLLLSKKSCQQSHHQHYQCVLISFIAEYQLQLLVLRLPNLYCTAV
jgi:hypothetical protein